MESSEFPESVAYVWEWFLALNDSRGSSGFGPSAITWPDISSYFGMHRLRPSASDLALIKKLDRVALESSAPEPAAEKQSGPKLKPGKPHLRGKRKT